MASQGAKKTPVLKQTQPRPPASAPPPGQNPGQQNYNVPPQYYLPPTDYTYVVGRSYLVEDITTRHRFIKRMYLILFLAWIVTFVASLPFYVVGALRNAVHDYSWIIAIPLIFHIFILLVLICWTNAGRYYPTNVILLIINAFTLGTIIGMLSAMMNSAWPILTSGFICVLVLVLACYSIQTRCEFYGCCVIPFILLALLIAVIGAVAVASLRTASLGIAIMVVFLYAIYLVLDTILILANKRYCLCEQQFIYGAISLFIDIQNLVTCIGNIMRAM